ncbi:adenylate/guanylate cyclase domain-containing protein [Oricola sp.]|uniref:CHASE2 domain-containing protein n=1 Tax=Oricola sp. TaxID=1979950 RepID=UPI0025E36D50|nr:adenylate/guanylate cyclase domain-containing protein [Oricola sp.]MCI5074288.1 adenylate/guanylate cyclase domain-containing protein [Oricola sp.]
MNGEKVRRSLAGARGLVLLFGALAAVLVALHVALSGTFASLREKTYDVYQSVSPIPLDFSQIAVVTIDEASLAKYGRWPWPREQVAAVVDAITDSGVAGVALDLFFAEPQGGSDGDASDAALADALVRAPSVLAMSLDPHAGPLDVPDKAGWTVVGLDPDAAASVDGGIGPLPLFAEAAAGLGIVRTLPDADGTIRKVPLIWAEAQSDGAVRLWPTMTLDLLRVAQGEASFTLRLEGLSSDAVRVGGVTVPLGEDGRIRIVDTSILVPHVSARDLLDEGPSEDLAGRVVLLAVDVAGVDQYHLTARGGHRLGADIHAILLAQMLNNRYLFEAPRARWLERSMFLGGGVLLLIILVAFSRRPLYAGLLSAPVILAPLAIGAVAYAGRDVLLDGVQPAAGLLVLGAAGGYMLYREAERRRGVLQKQFSQFLSPDVVKHLAETDTAAALKVEDREITAMLVDMRGFTSMSGELGADRAVKVVNHFLGIASREIFARNGTIDKFMGDAVLAFWNAPLEVPDHTDRAIECAQAIIAGVAAANPQLNMQDLPSIECIAAIEAGVCSVGNMGTEQRVDYTAIGPTINMTARLEGETKKMGQKMLIGPYAASLTKHDLTDLGEVELRGVSEPCRVHTPTVMLAS